MYLILFYVNDSVGLTKKSAISPRLLCYTTVILAFHHCTRTSRGRVLAFYRIAPCLRYPLLKILHLQDIFKKSARKPTSLLTRGSLEVFNVTYNREDRSVQCLFAGDRTPEIY